MSIQKVTFNLPNFTTIPDYDPEGLFDWVYKKQQNDMLRRDNKNHQTVARSVRKFPWMAECIPAGETGVVNSLVAETKTHIENGSFRPYLWHLDPKGKGYGSRLRLFATSTPAIVAAGTFVVDHPRLITNRDFVDIAEALGANTWLEKAIGIEPVKDNPEQPSIRSFIKDIVGLQIIPLEPGVLMDGLTDETLHTSAMLKPEDPTNRVIYRVQYDPPA